MRSRLLETTNLAVGYEGKTLIEDIELSLEKGQTVALIGPNGAGKSTIIKTLINQLSPIQGGIYFKEQNIQNMKRLEVAKSIAVVLTEPLHSEHMCCREIVETGRYPYTGRFGFLSLDDKRIVEEAMKLIQIEELAEKDFSYISDGQRQRVLLARAICQKPEILILDEPTSFLDIHYKIQFFEILKKLKETQKIGVLISIHELDMAYKVADYIVGIKGSHIAYMGKPEEIFKKSVLVDLYDLSDEMYETYLGIFNWG